jgi:hypothetical protein
MLQTLVRPFCLPAFTRGGEQTRRFGIRVGGVRLPSRSSCRLDQHLYLNTVVCNRCDNVVGLMQTREPEALNLRYDTTVVTLTLVALDRRFHFI